MLSIITHKKCCKCKEIKTINLFHKDKSKKDGLRYTCIECRRIYNQEDKKMVSEQKKEYYKENRKIIIEYAKTYRQKNKDRLNEEKKVYRTTPKGKVVGINASHRRRSLKGQGDVTTNQLLELKQTTKQCYWCGTSLKNKVVHIDHYVPISKGGLHTLSNIVVSCAKCNLAKSAKSPEVFANSIGKLL